MRRRLSPQPNPHRVVLRALAPTVALVLTASSAAVPAAGHAALRQRPPMRTEALGVRRPAGLVYVSDRDRFLVLPAPAALGEPAAARAELMTQLHEPAGSVTLPAPLTRERAVAWDAHGHRLLMLDVAARALYALPIEASGALESPRTVRLEAPRVAALRPAGMGVDPATGEVFVLDALMRRLIRFTPAAAGVVPAARSANLGPLAGARLTGLAFDPASGHLFTLDRGGARVVELTADGIEAASHPVADLGLVDPRGMIVAPSADQTDDPAARSLFVADPGLVTRRGHVVELVWTPDERAGVTPMSLQSTTAATLVRVTNTSSYSPPSPDPSGISYNPLTGRLIISDAEVEEMPLYAGKNVFEANLNGSLARSWTTLPWDVEPTGTAVNTNNRHLFISNDDADKVWDVNPGADGIYGTSDDSRTYFKTSAFGCGDAEGISYDPAGNRIFIADGVNEEIYIVGAGPNGVFNGVPPAGDDVVTHFDTHGLSVIDPETVEWKASTGTLLLLASTSNKILREVTTSGTQIATTDLSFAPLRKPAGLCYAPSSNGSGNSVYIVNRGTDNNSDPSENDGTLIEISLGGTVANTAPSVNAGTDQTLTLPAQAALDGTVSDDGLPSPPALTTTWSKVSGPGTVTFANANAVDTQASFSAAGTYVLQLAASDGALGASDQVQITVQATATNQAPSVFAGPDQTITLPAQASLDGTVSDDGLPSPPALTTTWSKVSGPGTVTFANANAVDTQASFSTAGTYVLQLAASDGSLSASDQVQIVVQPQGSSTSLSLRITNGLDDVEETATGSIYTNSTDLELVFDGSNQVVGLRFPNVAIPRGATIQSASVQFQADEAQSDPTTLTVQAQASGNAAAFTTAKLNVSSRARTAASVTWSPVPWSTVGEAGSNQRTPDLTAVLQEIVRRSDWVSGNAIVIILTGSGHRTCEAYEGLPAAAPLLQVQFQ